MKIQVSAVRKRKGQSEHSMQDRCSKVTLTANVGDSYDEALLAMLYRTMTSLNMKPGKSRMDLYLAMHDLLKNFTEPTMPSGEPLSQFFRTLKNKA